MRAPLYDVNARRKTASVVMNAGIIARDIREAMRMVDGYVAIHGMPFHDWADDAASQVAPATPIT
jgi:hypothetical protein